VTCTEGLILTADVEVLSALQKIINASGKSIGFDIVKMSRWIRCLFQLALTYDETVSLKCLDHATRIASTRKGVSSVDGPFYRTSY
jgi:hypothetical protein